MEYHDLSGNQVKLNYPALLNLANYAMAMAREEIRTRSAEFYYRWSEGAPDFTHLCQSAGEIERQASFLTKAINTVHALEGMKTREEVIFTDRPELTERSA